MEQSQRCNWICARVTRDRWQFRRQSSHPSVCNTHEKLSRFIYNWNRYTRITPIRVSIACVLASSRWRQIVKLVKSFSQCNGIIFRCFFFFPYLYWINSSRNITDVGATPSDCRWLFIWLRKWKQWNALTCSQEKYASST